MPTNDCGQPCIRLAWPFQVALLLALAVPVAWAGTDASAASAASAPEVMASACTRQPRKQPKPVAPQPPISCGDVIVFPSTTLVATEATEAERPSVPPTELPTAQESARSQAAWLGKVTAAVLGVLGVTLLLGGLLLGYRGNISFEGNAGGFGGRAWGWRISPPLVMLIGSAASVLLAVIVVAHLVQLGMTPPAVGGSGAAVPAKRSASSTPA